MKSFILGPTRLIQLLLCSIAFALAQGVADHARKRYEVVSANVECKVVGSWAPSDQITRFELDCGGKQEKTTNAYVVASYVRNPGPLTCTLYKSGSPDCNPRK
jgi:hypothetical protein